LIISVLLQTSSLIVRALARNEASPDAGRLPARSVGSAVTDGQIRVKLSQRDAAA
jgi:hypothetical protein